MTDVPELTPNERFHKHLKAPEYSEVLNELLKFGIEDAKAIKLTDSSHDENDIRLNYIVDKKWVLRFCNAPDMREKRMRELNRLIERYRETGIKCPAFIADNEGKYLHTWGQLLCYLSEYIDLPLASEVELKDENRLDMQVAESVARFAEKYRNIDLSETMGMYSLFDLSPFDVPNGVDEKQENFNKLIALLKSEDEYKLANRLEVRHAEIRSKLKSVYRELPRCVFQGDENFTNILIDEEQNFVGFIDFNLAGTEVIINQLANLAGFDYDEKHADTVGAKARLEFAISYFQDRIIPALRAYRTTAKERQALKWYAWIVMVAQWPVYCFFEYSIKSGVLKNEIFELLSMIADLPEDRLLLKLN